MTGIYQGISLLCRAILAALTTGLFTSGITAPALAQVRADGTTNTTIKSIGNNFTILKGISQGNNLFHSFSNFSIPTGGSATFNLTDTPNITTIFSRVTGGNISQIDGLIQTLNSNNPVSLFLINPNGIVFGKNASLNIGGSFMGTTANSIKFADGTEFSAVNPTAAPLLTMTVPVGLQFGSNPGSITHQSTGFQVLSGQALALVGGNLTITGGSLTAPSGHIELGSVAANSQVSFDPTTFVMNYGGAAGFQDIQMAQGARVDTSGAGGGSIQVQARQFSLEQGSQLRANTLGADNGGQITIGASDQISIVGTEDLSRYSIYLGNEDFAQSGLSGIFATVAAGATGNGGSINIDSPHLLVSQAGAIVTNTSGQGNAGNVSIHSQTLKVIGNPNGNGFPSILSTGTIGIGHGGNLTINADSLFAKEFVLIASDSNSVGDGGNLTVNVRRFQALNGVQFNTPAHNAGNGGNLTVNATESLELIGFSTWDEGSFSTGLFTSVEPGATGNGGNLSITTGRLSILQGAKVAADLVGKGRAGNITIQAKEIEVADPIVDFTGAVSGIVVSVVKGASGQGGNLNIVTDRLRVFNGGQITAATDGAGDAGNINIQARDINISGASADQKFRSGIFASSTTAFNAGSINIISDRLSVSDGSQITVSNSGSGDAGNLNITAQRIFLDHAASLRSEVNGGSQGNIHLNASDFLLQRHGSNIITNARGASTGGNIDISAGSIVAVPAENSEISANAILGSGGSIQIATQGIFGLKFSEQLTPESDITASSQFGVNGTVQVNTIGVNPNSGLVELPENVTDASQQIATGCSQGTGSSFVATGRGGVPQNPAQEVRSDSTWYDTRDIYRYRKNGAVRAQIPESPEVLVQATSWHRNAQGKIELVADKSPANLKQALTCSVLPRS